jgi:hypothetical protein
MNSPHCKTTGFVTAWLDQGVEVQPQAIDPDTTAGGNVLELPRVPLGRASTVGARVLISCEQIVVVDRGQPVLRSGAGGQEQAWNDRN